MSNNKEDEKPTCSCGRKMQVVEFKGYYDEFKYFECRKCDIDADDFKTEEVHSGVTF